MKNKLDKVIITDDKGKPMAWSGGQLCYCTDEFWQDDPHPVRVYTVSYARLLINRSVNYRKQSNLSIDIDYKLMPIKLPQP